MTYTLADLKAMPNAEFERAVTDRMAETRDWEGPWQHPEIIHRTAAALVVVLGYTNAKIERLQSERATEEKISRTRQFREHLEAVIDSTDRRIAWLEQRREHTETRLLKRWRQVAQELADALEITEMAHELDRIETPHKIPVREWIQNRRRKDPSREPVRVDEEVEAA